MIIKDAVRREAENLAYNTFEINTYTAKPELDDVEVEFDNGEIIVYLSGVYFIDFKSAFYKDDIFKFIRDGLDEYKDKDLSDKKISKIARKAFLAIDEEYHYYVNEVDSYYDMDMRNSIQWFDRHLGDAVISVEGNDGEMIEGSVREILEEEYGHYEVDVFAADFTFDFFDYREEILVDYMYR